MRPSEPRSRQGSRRVASREIPVGTAGEVLPHVATVLLRDVAALMREETVLLRDIAVLMREVAVLTREHAVQSSFRFLQCKKIHTKQSRSSDLIDSRRRYQLRATRCRRRRSPPRAPAGILLVARPTDAQLRACRPLFLQTNNRKGFGSLLPTELISRAASPVPKREDVCSASTLPTTCAR